MRNADCKQCKLHSTCKTVCTWGRWLDPVRGGTSSKNLMVVFDAPDNVADDNGKTIPSVIEIMLQELCAKLAIDAGRVYVTNLIKCRPVDTFGVREIKACYKYIEEEIDAVRPSIIITMGAKASEELAGATAKHADRGIGVPFESGGHECIVLPTYDLDTLRKQPWTKNEVLTDFRSAWQFLTKRGNKRRPNYKVNDLRDLWMCAEGLDARKSVYVFDIETDGEKDDDALDPQRGRLWMLGVSLFDDEGDCSGSWLFTKADLEEGRWSQVGNFIEDRQKHGASVVAQNGKFDLQFLRHHIMGWDGVTLTHDTQIMHHLLNENASHKLAALEWRYCPERAHKLQSIDLSKQFAHEVDQTELADYCIDDVLSTGIIYFEMMKGLLAQNLVPLSKMLAEVSSILADTERLGCPLDMNRLNYLLADAESEALRHAHFLDLIAKELGVHDLNLESHEQVKRMLYETLCFDEYKDEDNKVSADREALDALVTEATHGKHKMMVEGALAFVIYLREYRQWHYLAQTLKGIKDKAVLIDEYHRIRTSYFMTGTVTGRLSSRNPNLQNIPTRQKIGRRVKEVFVPRDGYVFVYADYSQAEYRLAAEMSKDDIMIELFKSGEDFHEATAKAINTRGGSVSRATAKNINFADLYGAGDRKVAAMSGLPEHEVTVLRRAKRDLFQRLTRWIEHVPRQAVGNGGRVTGIFGRVRRVPYASSAIKWWSSRAARQLVNSPVQGSAADLTLLAIANVQRYINDTKYEDCDAPRVVLTIHDSIMWEVPADYADTFAAEVKTIMENPRIAEFGIQYFSVPIVADVETYTRNWGDESCTGDSDGEEEQK